MLLESKKKFQGRRLLSFPVPVAYNVLAPLNVLDESAAPLGNLEEGSARNTRLIGH